MFDSWSSSLRISTLSSWIFFVLVLAICNSLSSSSYSPCISSIVLWFGTVKSRLKKINWLNLRSTLVLAFIWFKFWGSTLESCFCVDFRFYEFSFIIFLCWTLDLNFLPKYLVEKKTQKSKCKSLNLCCLRVFFSHSFCLIMF